MASSSSCAEILEPVTPGYFEELRGENLGICGGEQTSAEFRVVQDEVFQVVDRRAAHRTAKLTDYARPNHERPNRERPKHKRSVVKDLVTTRRVRLPDDAEFLLAVYHSTRQAELELVSWSDADKDAFVRSQFEAQSRHYREYSPNAENSVVVVGGVPAGRLIVERSESSVHIVDIALLPTFRRAGSGSELVNGLLKEADERGVPVTCYVEVGNEACRFWERLGFVGRGSDGVYISLERPCGT